VKSNPKNYESRLVNLVGFFFWFTTG